MSETLLDTDDLGEAEAALSSLYAAVRLWDAPDPPARFRITETGAGMLTVHEIDYGAGFRYAADPFEKLVLCLPHTGALEQRCAGGAATRAGRGELVSVGAGGLPFEGAVHGGRFSLLVLDFDSLSEQASPRAGERVRLTDARPLSAAASRHLATLVTYVREVASSALTAETPLLAAEIRRHVAATVLATFRTTAHFDPTREDRRDSTPEVLRRAIAFMEENASRHLSLAEIASAVYVTPRALQYGFRRHCDCTPLEYLRRIRLHYAHLDLVAGDPAAVTVADIARRWGFGHAGRFGAFHRAHFGESSQSTLRDGS